MTNAEILAHNAAELAKLEIELPEIPSDEIARIANEGIERGNKLWGKDDDLAQLCVMGAAYGLKILIERHKGGKT